ncbi:MAG: SPOR domain-containing protein [Agarilytica sp.]
MARHSHSQASRTKESARIPAWVWLFTGAILGAFVMFLLHLSEVSPQDTSYKDQKPIQQIEKQKPRFDFYELLKESDIPILTESESDANEQPTQSGPEVEYLLQVASFKSKEDAEQLRAQLLLLNLTAYTENAKIRNGETWHRVLVGPFKSKSKLSKARSTLLSNHHEALVLKRQP